MYPTHLRVPVRYLPYILGYVWTDDGHVYMLMGWYLKVPTPCTRYLRARACTHETIGFVFIY